MAADTLNDGKRGWGQPFTIGADNGVHGACCPPTTTSAPEPGSKVPLASTLFGASLFLECFAEPRTVVSVGISVPSCFGKSHLIGGMGGRGWVFFFFFSQVRKSFTLSNYLWVKVEFLEVLAFS